MDFFLQGDVAGIPTSAMAIIGLVVAGLLGLATYNGKAHTDKIAPAMDGLTKAVLLLPAAMKDAVREAVKEAFGSACDDCRQKIANERHAN